MTEATFYAESVDGYVESSHATYANARAGANLAAVNGVAYRVGQRLSGGTYYVYQPFLSFDTSSIPDGATITAAVLHLYGRAAGDLSTTDFTIEARTFDWGAGVTVADYVAGASLSALTRLATFGTAGWATSAYNAMTEDGTNLRAAINKTGITRLLLTSARTVANTTPTNDEFVVLPDREEGGTTITSKLVVTYTESVTHLGEAALALATTLVALAATTYAGAAALATAITLAASGGATRHAAAAASLSATLAAVAHLTNAAAATLPATVTIAADAKVNDFQLATTALAITAALNPTANNTQNAAAALALSVTLSALGHGAKDAAAALSLAVALDVVGNVTRHRPALRAPAGTGRYGILPPAGLGSLRR